MASVCLLISTWTEQTATILRIAALVVQGVGLGLFQLAYSDIVTATLPLRDRGVAGSLVLLTRTLGTVTAASVIFLVFGILNATYGFLEGFQRLSSLRHCWHLSQPDLAAFSPRRDRRPAGFVISQSTRISVSAQISDGFDLHQHLRPR